MKRVLVTGGTGFIGSWCILALLDAGHPVRTTVRDLRREPELRSWLHAAAPFDDDRLTVVRADLEKPDGWDDAVADCEYVLHVASPTLRHVPAHDDELVVPAREGVLRVLRAARDAGVRRVVLTSAFGAIGIGHPERSTPFTEEDWTDVDSDIPPYQRSKTLAERAAWEFVEDEGGGLEMAAVHPVGVLGPVLGADDPPSLRLVRRMLEGRVPACPPFGMGYVDVRDVADLHLRAMTDPAADGERFLAIAGHSIRLVDMARILRDRLGERAAKAPTRELPVWLTRALGTVNPELRLLRHQLGRDLDATSAKAERLLGWRARPIEDTIADTAESLLAHGIGT
ncbi:MULTISPECIES: aldehyde reductase [unclassified Streptomyces]|jgi:nucleoside-diphosphate-sugar epimerase|uniref:SDR family oxidoreductase n=1 Tax=unclassified Streptomyces TaxID=2593676 RepID=UPI000F4E0C8E|nr:MULTISPECIES: aldehyde reductase [unclassified Streptomyces]MDH6455299.1 dihydroflavonol-4-reductase [Streptomyces sp. SAI-119]MDH6494148.1 dihydroflavonol-4-reductase [Streptomyces sp. SAI-149]QUC58665.1 aldehyde reductase [Streptomyces sp. A2-16]GLP69202.1 dihydroflavonol-4-reductase [Streptomyces sp. TUS-ST3]